MTSATVGGARVMLAAAPASPATLPERERQERVRFAARVVEHARDGLGLRTAARSELRLELQRGRTTFVGHLDAPGRWRALVLGSLLVLLAGVALLASYSGPWPWHAVRVTGWAGWVMIAASLLVLMVSAWQWRRSRRSVVVLVDARRRRLGRDVLRSHWEQVSRTHEGPVVLWVFARGGLEHAALAATVDLPVRCFGPTRESFVELRLPGR